MTRREIQAYVAHLTQAGYAPKSIDHIHDVLSALLHGGEVGSPPGKPCAGRRLADAQMRASQVGTDAKPSTLAADGVAGSCADDAQLQQIDLHWHDLRHEGACRLLADGVDIRTIQLMLGHSDIKTRQRYLNITDEELRKALTGVWERRRQLKAVGQ
jgi:integrase